MAYGEAAVARRRCTATRKDGTPCRAWALWGDPRQRCVFHAGARERRTWAPWWGRQHARYTPCRCGAYAWPHRPGSGLCRWPEAPAATCPTPAGTHGRRWWGWRSQPRETVLVFEAGWLVTALRGRAERGDDRCAELLPRARCRRDRRARAARRESDVAG
jgi:hypothetical protein